MATIRKRGNKWQARIQRRSQPVAHTFLTRSDAEKWARQTEVDIDRGVYLRSTRHDQVTLRELIQRYATDVTPQKKGAQQERQRLGRWATHPLASRQARTIRGSDIARYRDERTREGLSGSTVRLELAALSQVFTVAAKEWGFETLQNPVGAIRRPPPGKGRDRRLYDGELDRILATCLHPELPSLIQLAIETAMRRGELVSLRWDATDLTRAVTVLKDTKNDERRVVPLSGAALSILRGMPRRFGGCVFGLNSMQATCLFRDAVSRARKIYEKECQKAGTEPNPSYLKNLRLHDLRHEAVSRLFERGLTVMEVTSISGHRSLAMARRYTHLKAEELAKRLA